MLASACLDISEYDLVVVTKTALLKARTLFHHSHVTADEPQQGHCLLFENINTVGRPKRRTNLIQHIHASQAPFMALCCVTTVRWWQFWPRIQLQDTTCEGLC
jgi:hypothetical protein